MGVLLGLAAGALVACGPANTPIPPGVQQVHFVVDGNEVRLEPATVRAGEIYVVLDTPGSSVGFVQRQRTATETPGPLRDDDLARLATGDTQGTAIGGFDDVGCTAEQRAEHRGQTGPCGNVSKLVLSEGRYAFFTGDLEGAAQGGAPPSIAVLDVLP